VKKAVAFLCRICEEEKAATWTQDQVQAMGKIVHGNGEAMFTTLVKNIVVRCVAV